ncbi:hypothetical protein SISNIDRAFT_497516 [Sistotremastrum niveocremeum HHB9708]|uniref:F-box domain-containing protein n=1 Tax=Sistotremastrum niveocremeum HHB9708 TaxID=1314777 RepID=A0A164Q3X9_9AGAM|nr:hypothetical protein SISNIDRAFT_497516 [Sistotremastrum niveocremeum HHB9708]
MLVDELPTEILHKIMKLAVEELHQNKRLQATLRLGLLNRRLRAVSLNCPDLWSTIYLPWPQEVVLLYLQRARESCQNPTLIIYLDTHSKHFRPKEKNTVRVGYYASFLTQHMASIKALHVVIDPEHRSPLLAAAFTYPAPLLEIFDLNITEKIHFSTELFAKQAPKLRVAKFRSLHYFNFGPAIALRDLNIRIDQQNAKGFLNMIAAAPGIESLTLVGAEDPLPVSTHLQERRPIVLSHCRSLTIQRMHWISARRLLPILKLPSLEELIYHEIQEITAEDPAIAMESALRHIVDNTSALPASSLNIDLYMHRVNLSLDGTPSIRITSDWPDPTSPVPPLLGNMISRRIYTTLENILLAPACALHAQPEKLVIYTETKQPEHNSVLTSSIREDVKTLFRRVLGAYPSVKDLMLLRVLEDIPSVLLNNPDILPNLSVLTSQNEHSPKLFELERQVERARKLRLHQFLVFPGIKNSA